MKKVALIAVAFLISLSACQKVKENRTAVALGQTDSLYSNILKKSARFGACTGRGDQK